MVRSWREQDVLTHRKMANWHNGIRHVANCGAAHIHAYLSVCRIVTAINRPLVRWVWCNLVQFGTPIACVALGARYTASTPYGVRRNMPVFGQGPKKEMFTNISVFRCKNLDMALSGCQNGEIEVKSWCPCGESWWLCGWLDGALTRCIHTYERPTSGCNAGSQTGLTEAIDAPDVKGGHTGQ